MNPCWARRAQTCFPEKVLSLPNRYLKTRHKHLGVQAGLDLRLGGGLKEELQSFHQVRSRLVDGRSLAGHVHVRAEGHVAVAFSFDDRGELHGPHDRSLASPLPVPRRSDRAARGLLSLKPGAGSVGRSRRSVGRAGPGLNQWGCSGRASLACLSGRTTYLRRTGVCFGLGFGIGRSQNLLNRGLILLAMLGTAGLAACSGGGLGGAAGAAGWTSMAGSGGGGGAPKTGAGGSTVTTDAGLGGDSCTGTLVLGAAPLPPTGKGPNGVAMADLNRDGKLDLVTVNHDEDTVSVFLGIGDGRFHAKLDYAVGSGPNVLALGDLNGDGTPDVVVVNTASNSVSVLLGAGRGSWPPPLTTPSTALGRSRLPI